MFSYYAEELDICYYMYVRSNILLSFKKIMYTFNYANTYIRIYNYIIFMFMHLLTYIPGGVAIITTPASPLPIALVATTENL